MTVGWSTEVVVCPPHAERTQTDAHDYEKISIIPFIYTEYTSSLSSLFSFVEFSNCRAKIQKCQLGLYDKKGPSTKTHHSFFAFILCDKEATPTRWCGQTQPWRSRMAATAAAATAAAAT